MKKINFLILLSLILCDSFLFAHAGANTNEFETKKGAMIETQKIKTGCEYVIDYHYWGTLFQPAAKFMKNPLLGFEKGASLVKFNWVQRLVKHSQSDTAKKPESFWTTVVLGFIFVALMLFLNVPLAMLFFFIISGIGLGGYYFFRKRNKKIAEAFLTIATALNLGLGVVAVYGIWLGSVVD
ncbi:MAG: hypothetical protein R2830_05240 [Saprospiraceae bacterium]